jgi:hypothetical protein
VNPGYSPYSSTLTVKKTALYCAESYTLGIVEQKYAESLEMPCWRRMGISLTDRVRNEEVLHRVKEERSIQYTTKQRKTNWIVHVLSKKCLLKHIIEGKVEGMGRRGRRRKQILYALNRRRSLKLAYSFWKTRFGRGCGTVITDIMLLKDQGSRIFLT